jgi:hypothetical protein
MAHVSERFKLSSSAILQLKKNTTWLVCKGSLFIYLEKSNQTIAEWTKN